VIAERRRDPPRSRLREVLLDRDRRRGVSGWGTALDDPVLLEETHEVRFEHLVSPNAREIVLLRDELQVERHDEQRERRRVLQGLRELRLRWEETRRDRQRADERRLERREELVVVERVEAKQRGEHVPRLGVVARAGVRGFADRRLEHVEEMEVAA